MDDSTRNDQSNLPVIFSRLLARRPQQQPVRRHDSRVARLRNPTVAGVVATVAGVLLEEVLRRALTSASPLAQPPSAHTTAPSEVYLSRETVVKETIRVRSLRI
jgi:hypothetical protein